MDKIIDNIKNFLFSNKKRTLITIIALVIVSFGIGYLVLAASDYDNFYTITNENVEIEDGTPYIEEITNADGSITKNEVWDENHNVGNDDSPKNEIVRNFDNIIYNVSFTLSCKEGMECPSGASRNVEVHIWVPENTCGNITSQLVEGASISSDNADAVNSLSNYKHYVLISENQVSTENMVSISVPVNASNGETIKPKIVVRESTDDNTKDLTKDDSFIGKDLLAENKPVTVTAVDRLAVKLYGGTKTDVDKTVSPAGSATIPIGIVLYIPVDPIKGIKGAQVPSKQDYNLNIKYVKTDGTPGDGTIEYIDRGDYNSENKEKYKISNLPSSYDNNNGKNADIGYKGDGSTKTFELNFTNINYNTGIVNLNEGKENTVENNVPFISSNIFAIKSLKAGAYDANVEFSLCKVGGTECYDTIRILDNYEEYVGALINKIDFFDSNMEISSDKEFVPATAGQAMYNYGEEFFIQDYMKYGTSDTGGGDVLNKGLTNYIKVDNEIVKIIKIDDGYDYYAKIEKGDDRQTDDKFVVSFGIGEWDTSYFEKQSGSDVPSYCKNVDLNDKNQLMNAYGGPCVKEKNNAITWIDSNDKTNIDGMTDEQRNKIILVRFDFKDKYYPGTETTIKLKAQIVNNTENVWNTTQVVSRGYTEYEGVPFYLSETARESTDLNYTKSSYDVNTQTFTNDQPNGAYGNTILVTPFKSKINKITVTDKYDSEKDVIYSGITDPLTIKINPGVSKSSMDAKFTSANVIVYLPSELELDIQKGDKIPEQVVSDKEHYNKYIYSYSEDDISRGEHAATMDNLVLHAYIDISTSDDTKTNIISYIEAVMKPNDDPNNADKSYFSSTPLDSRTNTKEVTLRNTKVIGTIGKISPTYFEKNGTMIYNMRSANISGGTADLSLLKVLPYTGDDLSDGSNYEGSISVKLNELLPEGYQIYYTKADPKSIVSNELNSSSLNSWVTWTNYTNNISGITAIKITTPEIKNNEYFAGKSGINITMTTSGNTEGSEYYNNFYILQKGSINCENELEGDCSNTSSNSITLYASNISYSSVYNRSISGSVFEDYNYDGFYSNDEKKLKDIPVEVYKLSNTNITDKKDTINLMSDSDELVAETITDNNGSYRVKGLQQGNYYVKYTFDCEKYTATEKNKQNLTNSIDTSDIDSDASMVANECSAVSNIITLDNESVQKENIDLGLRIRQNFDVSIKKYITNVTVNSTKGTTSYDYNNETKVKIDVKNLKNTSFRVTYSFVIENSKYFPGTIGQIVESIPEGMTFDPTLPENDGWYMSGNYLYYTKYSKTYILPDEKYYMTVVLDLKTDNGGDYLNVIAAQDLKIMDTTVSLLDGIQIADYNYASTSDENTNGKQ